MSDPSTSRPSSKAIKVAVICRIRPPRPEEYVNPSCPTVDIAPPRTIRLDDLQTGKAHKFEFSAVYDEKADQDEIFEGQVQDLCQMVWLGQNATIFAYGATGSGKTHTMQGTPSDPGLIPRVASSLFNRLSSFRRKSKLKATVKMSYFEVYKEKVWDLLDEERAGQYKPGGDLPIREDASGNVFVARLIEHPLPNLSSFNDMYQQASGRRYTASTKLNNASSRSHAVLEIHVEIVEEGKGGDDGKVTCGKISMVDLAGSENNKKTGNEASDDRMKESVEINKSLSCLKNVVEALNKGDTRIPYRDSKLTRILSDALGGNSAGLVICNISPAQSAYQETKRTLTFAGLSRNVENRPETNERNLKPPRIQHFSAPTLVPKSSRPNMNATGLNAAAVLAAAKQDSQNAPSHFSRHSTTVLSKNHSRGSAPLRTNHRPQDFRTGRSSDQNRHDIARRISRENPGLTQEQSQKIVQEVIERTQAQIVESQAKMVDSTTELVKKLVEERLKEEDERRRKDEDEEREREREGRKKAKAEKKKRKAASDEEEENGRERKRQEAVEEPGESQVQVGLSAEERKDRIRALMESGLAARNKKDLKRAIQFFEMALELANSEKMKNKIRVKIDDVKSSFLIVAEDEDEPGEEFEAVTKSYNTKTKQVAAVLGERHVNSWPLASVVNAANAPTKKMKHQGTQTPPRKKHKSDLDPPLPSEEIVAYRTEEAALALRQVDSTLATLPASGSEQEGDGKDELTSEDRKRLENQILDIFNTANEKKIKKLKTVGTKRAEDIANYVEDEGEIGDWKLLGDIPGLSKAVREKLVMANRHLLND